MEFTSNVLFLRDLSKLERDAQSGEWLLARRLQIDKITVFGIIVDIEKANEEEVSFQIG